MTKTTQYKTRTTLLVQLTTNLMEAHVIVVEYRMPWGLIAGNA